MPVLYGGEVLKYWIAHRGLLVDRPFRCGCNASWTDDETDYLIAFGSFGKVVLFRAAEQCPKCRLHPWKRLVRIQKEAS